MAKGKRKRHGSSPSAPSNEEILGELEAKANEIASGDPAAAGPLWGAVHKLLLKTNADPGEAAALIARRDTDGLATMARVLRGEESAEPAEAVSRAQVPAETMAKALRAFRRRLKLVRLDHESRLGVGPMTSGRKADFDAIMAPQEYPGDVWEALADAGQIKRAGKGFYMLPEA